MNGRGVGDADDGSCELHLSAKPVFPTGFDPVSCPMICSHPTSSFFSRPLCVGESFADLAGGSYRVLPARQGDIYSEHGDHLAHLEVTSTVAIDNGVLVSHHAMSGFAQLPPLEQNILVGDDHVFSAGPGRALACVGFGLLTKSGERLQGMCTIPYELADADRVIPVLARTVDHLQVDWDGGPQVSAYYRTSIRALSDVASLVPVGITV
jgi:hypothetical protein